MDWLYVILGIIAIFIIFVIIMRIKNSNQSLYSPNFISQARNRSRDGCEQIINKIKKFITGC